MADSRPIVAKDVILNVAEKHTLDVAVNNRKASETLEVTAENTPIQTTTAEESGTVTGEQVRELALNNRNFEQLMSVAARRFESIAAIRPVWFGE